jgi:lysophospholipase L1-like esterase
VLSLSRMARPALRALVLLLVLLAGFELAVRFDDWARFGVALDSPATSLEELYVRDSLGGHARPGSAFRQFHVNALGFRGPEYRPAEHRGEMLVVAAGASETFGLYEAPGREWPQQLGDSLRARCAGTPVTVLNAAFAGMSLPTVIQDLRLRVLPMRPTAVVVYPTPSQYLEATAPVATPPSSEPPARLDPWRSRGFPRVRDAVKRTIPQPVMDVLRRVVTSRRVSRDTPFRTVPMARLDSLEEQLRVLVGVVRKGGAAVVLGVHQNRFADTNSVAERRWLRAWEFQSSRATGQVLLQMDSLAARRIERVGADSSVPVFDPKLSSRPDRAALFADYLHFTDRGAAIMGRSTAAAVASVTGCPGAGGRPPTH